MNVLPLCLWFVPGLLASCASYGRPLAEVAPEINATLYQGPTLIESGDVLDLRFPRKLEWNQTITVRSDGLASFPIIGELRAAGRSIEDLTRALEDRYRRGVLEDPDVTLNTQKPVSQAFGGGGTSGGTGIVITGEVNTPGMISLSGERVTLLEALGQAGGHLKATALLGNTLLVRRSPRTGQYSTWRIDARVANWGTGDPIYLQKRDMVFVPNTPIDDVNRWIDQYINKIIPVGITPFVLGIVVADQ